MLCGETREQLVRSKGIVVTLNCILQDYMLHLQLASCHDVTHFPTWESCIGDCG
jgi:hypothetical protein